MSALVVTLLSIVVTCVSADSNITLISLPVNITSLKLAFRDAINHSLSDRLDELRDSLQGHVTKYVELFKNVSADCTSEGKECFPDVPSCCPGVNEDEVDLECLPDGDTFTCRKPRSEEQAEMRLDALQYGDSKAMLESHPWTNSWEFQSRSVMEREEQQAAEEAEWKKNWKPSPTDNFWVKMYKNMKKGGKDIWNDVRKLKKLKEFKDKMVDKYKRRMARTTPPKTTPEEKSEEIPNRNREEKPDKTAAEGTPEHDTVASWLYPDVSAEDNEGKGKESDESVIKFSDEIPKPEKKIDFRIDEIIKDAARLMEKKLKEKTKAQESNKVVPTYSLEGGDPLRLREIEDTEDKLTNEIEELKRLKERRSKIEEDYRPDEVNIEELIKKQVRLVLDEERKLDKLRKMEELKRLEGDMKYQGEIQT